MSSDDQNQDVKAFLYAWLGKQKKATPQYEVRPAGNKNRQRFLCQLSVAGYAYTACGNSTSKKEAQSNAARDFVLYLQRSGEMKEGEAPKAATGETPFATMSGQQAQNLGLHQRHRPDALGEAYRKGQQGQNDQQGGGDFRRDFLEEAQRRRVADAEEADVNAAMHGNWTMENAKSALNQWMQANRVKAETKFSSAGPDHNKSFVAEMGFHVRQLGRMVSAREAGSNKQSASKSCALSLVRQLFHLGVIEAFSGTLKKNKDVEELPPHEVSLKPELVDMLKGELQKREMRAVDVGRATIGEGQTLSLVTESAAMATSNEPGGQQQARAVSWSPPTQNW